MLSAAHCAADVQAKIPFSLKAQEQGPLFSQVFCHGFSSSFLLLL